MTTTTATPATTTECPSCRYTSGHTSWCPNRPPTPICLGCGHTTSPAPHDGFLCTWCGTTSGPVAP